MVEFSSTVLLQVAVV